MLEYMTAWRGNGLLTFAAGKETRREAPSPSPPFRRTPFNEVPLDGAGSLVTLETAGQMGQSCHGGGEEPQKQCTLEVWNSEDFAPHGRGPRLKGCWAFLGLFPGCKGQMLHFPPCYLRVRLPLVFCPQALFLSLKVSGS